MVIIYGTRTVFKREGPVGTSVCPNCRHNVMHTLCRQLNQATLFYIPIFGHQKQRGIMCESCGMITPVSAQEYRERKQAAHLSSDDVYGWQDAGHRFWNLLHVLQLQLISDDP